MCGGEGAGSGRFKLLRVFSLGVLGEMEMAIRMGIGWRLPGGGGGEWAWAWAWK